MAQAITITLPDNLYDKLKRTAALVDEPLETIVTQSLSPLLDEIPAEYQADVYPYQARTGCETPLGRQLRQPLERVRELSGEQNEGCGLLVGLCPALFPLL